MKRLPKRNRMAPPPRLRERSTEDIIRRALHHLIRRFVADIAQHEEKAMLARSGRGRAHAR